MVAQTPSNFEAGGNWGSVDVACADDDKDDDEDIDGGARDNSLLGDVVGTTVGE